MALSSKTWMPRSGKPHLLRFLGGDISSPVGGKDFMFSSLRCLCLQQHGWAVCLYSALWAPGSRTASNASLDESVFTVKNPKNSLSKWKGLSLSKCHGFIDCRHIIFSSTDFSRYVCGIEEDESLGIRAGWGDTSQWNHSVYLMTELYM